MARKNTLKNMAISAAAGLGLSVSLMNIDSLSASEATPPVFSSEEIDARVEKYTGEGRINFSGFISDIRHWPENCKRYKMSLDLENYGGVHNELITGKDVNCRGYVGLYYFDMNDPNKSEELSRVYSVKHDVSKHDVSKAWLRFGERWVDYSTYGPIGNNLFGAALLILGKSPKHQGSSLINGVEGSPSIFNRKVTAKLLEDAIDSGIINCNIDDYKGEQMGKAAHEECTEMIDSRKEWAIKNRG